MTPVTVYERGDLERTRVAGHVARLKMETIRTIFSHSNLKSKPEDKLVVGTFTSLAKHNGKFFMEIILSSKILRKCNRFSIVILNLRDS